MHARRQLSTPQTGGFPVYLSIHWYERLADRPPGGTRRAGREILRVDLSRPLPEVIAKHRVADARSLEGFRMEYGDHLEHLTTAVAQDDARERLLAAVLDRPAFRRHPVAIIHGNDRGVYGQQQAVHG